MSPLVEPKGAVGRVGDDVVIPSAYHRHLINIVIGIGKVIVIGDYVL